jgi:hypothetical protein
MIDDLRRAWRRALTARARRRLLAVAALVVLAAAALVILAAALVLALIDEPEPARRAPLPPTGSGHERPARSVAVPADADAVRPGEEGHSGAAVASRGRVQAARLAALRFLAGYVPYRYGQRSARSIPNAGHALRRRLAAHAPRVPARERRRRSRIVLIHGDGVGSRRAGMVALVDDGARQYTVALELVRARRGWQVIDVSG